MPLATQSKTPADYSAGVAHLLYPGASLGTVLYVDGSVGLDTNSGFDAQHPKLTIAAALALCTNDHNDTIIILDYYNMEGGAAVTINKSKVNIIGSPGGCKDRSWTCLHATADTACLVIAAHDVRVQGLYFDAGAAHGGIEFSGGVCRVGVLGCWFGTGAYGVYSAPGGIGFSLEVADCFFCQALTGSGIYLNDDPAFIFLHDNWFDQAQAAAISVVQGGGGRICDNTIACGSDAVSTAIVLGASVTRCLVARNYANFGDADMAANPFTDNAAGDVNHWMGNMKGITLIHPA